MQIKKLAALLAAASLATVMLTGCPWDEEDKTDDAASSTPGSSSSSSQPGGDEDDGPTTYTITASVNGEGGSVSVSETNVTAGGAVTVTISPDADYTLASIIDNKKDVTSEVTNNKTYTIQNVTEDHAITVTFKSTIDPKDPTTWKTTGTAPNKTIIAPAGIKLSQGLADEMLAVDGVDSIDLSQSDIASIPPGCFNVMPGKQSKLVSITVQDNTTIEPGAFGGCTNLTTVNGTLSEVGGLAFLNCESLTCIAVNGNVGYEAFYNCSSLQHLRVGEKFNIPGTDAFSVGISLTVYYDDPWDSEFERDIESKLNNNGVSVDHFVPNCTEDDWNDILESNKPTIEANPTPDNALARLILGL